MHGDDTTRSTGDLNVHARARESTVEVTVAGNLDMAAALQLETKLEAVLVADEVRAIQLDLADVGFIDSAGLGALLAVRERAGELGIDLAITPVSDRVRRILELTGLGEIAGG